jgi:hypothetical protein
MIRDYEDRQNDDTSAATSPLPDVPICTSDVEMLRRPCVTNTRTFNVGPPS